MQCFRANVLMLQRCDETVKHVVDIQRYLAVLQSSRSIQAGCTEKKSFLSYRKGKFDKALFYFSLSFTNLPQNELDFITDTYTERNEQCALIRRV